VVSPAFSFFPLAKGPASVVLHDNEVSRNLVRARHRMCRLLALLLFLPMTGAVFATQSPVAAGRLENSAAWFTAEDSSRPVEALGKDLHVGGWGFFGSDHMAETFGATSQRNDYVFREGDTFHLFYNVGAAGEKQDWQQPDNEKAFGHATSCAVCLQQSDGLEPFQIFCSRKRGIGVLPMNRVVRTERTLSNDLKPLTMQEVVFFPS
jgi:hypothetical protein